MGLFYCTREQVKQAAQVNGPDENASIDRLLESTSREIERILGRLFYGYVSTRYYDFPVKDADVIWSDARNYFPYDDSTDPVGWPIYESVTQNPIDRRILLKADLLVVDTLTVDGDTVTAYYLEPFNEGPPYTRIELETSVADPGGDARRRAVAIAGTWGYCNTQAAAGALAEADDGSETALDVTDSSLIGVGDLILIGAESMIVTEKNLLATAAIVNMAGNIAADESVVAITFDGTGSVKQGEIITIGAERMLVEAVAGSVLTVKRSYDGSVLAAHLNDDGIYAPRTLTVERAAVGTTAATHSAAAAITKNVPPGLIAELCLAETIYARTQEQGHMALTVGQGEAVREISGKGIADVRKRVAEAYGKTKRGPRST